MLTLLRLFLILFFCFYAEMSIGKIYKFIDSNNVIHFSDFHDTDAAKNSEELSLKDNDRSSYSNESVSYVAIPSQSQKNDFNYESLIIDYPKNNETIFFDANGLEIKYQIKPVLRKQDRVVFLLDNNLIPNPLKNVTRGEHELQMKIYSKDDKEIGCSNIITFFMRQNAIVSH